MTHFDKNDNQKGLLSPWTSIIIYHTIVRYRPPTVFFNFLKMGQSRHLFVYFSYFLDTISIIQIEKSIDGVLEIRTWGRRMVGADATTELILLPCCLLLFSAAKGMTINLHFCTQLLVSATPFEKINDKFSGCIFTNLFWFIFRWEIERWSDQLLAEETLPIIVSLKR